MSAYRPRWIKTGLALLGKRPRARQLIDAATAIPTGLAALYFSELKSLDLARLSLNSRILERVGIWPVRRQYDEPYFDRSMLRRPLDEPRDLPGLRLNTDRSLRLIPRLAEFAEEPIVGTIGSDGLSYSPENGMYGLPDAALLYAILRTAKPARLVEVGAGHSTLVSQRALDRNRAEGSDCDHVCIEPFEAPWLGQLSATVLRTRVEDADAALFHSLDSGDVLFVDGSHSVRPQGDVLAVVQEILPRLRPGVIVHIHDLLTPRDYPESWVLDGRTMWNEQYLVEAFLTWNDEFEILFAAHHIYTDHRASFDRLRPELAGREWHEPTALWLRRKPGGADPLFGA